MVRWAKWTGLFAAYLMAGVLFVALLVQSGAIQGDASAFRYAGF